MGEGYLRVLEAPKPAHQEAIVAKLEEFLAAAKRGEFEGGMLLFERAASADLVVSVLGTNDLARTLGHMRLLERDLIEAQLQGDG